MIPVKSIDLLHILTKGTLNELRLERLISFSICSGGSRHGVPLQLSSAYSSIEGTNLMTSLAVFQVLFISNSSSNSNRNLKIINQDWKILKYWPLFSFICLGDISQLGIVAVSSGA